VLQLSLASPAASLALAPHQRDFLRAARDAGVLTFGEEKLIYYREAAAGFYARAAYPLVFSTKSSSCGREGCNFGFNATLLVCSAGAVLLVATLRSLLPSLPACFCRRRGSSDPLAREQSPRRNRCDRHAQLCTITRKPRTRCMHRHRQRRRLRRRASASLDA
jgi:hypothetical protein